MWGRNPLRDVDENAQVRTISLFRSPFRFYLNLDSLHLSNLLTPISLKASFLGDADFPKSAERYVKGGRIRLYEVVYERYSKLAFSIIQDRPLAISGLEKRLIRTFNTVGRYGIFDIYFQRGLLWARAGNTMTRINSDRGQRVPSWSWMGYAGGIKYVEIPFGQSEWDNDIYSPFSRMHRNASGKCVEKRKGAKMMELRAVAREFHRDRGEIIFDEPGKKQDGKLRCVIVGKEKVAPDDRNQKHYVLIIAELEWLEDQGIYERVAAGYMEGRHISLDTPGETVFIQ